MIRLIDVTEDNYIEICKLAVSEEQLGYVATSVRILASAYANRNRNARAWAITDDETIVGVLMVKDLFEEPVCYTIEQFMIDYRYQNKGYGKKALTLAIDMLSEERRYENIEVCVKMAAVNAVRMYYDIGFVDTGYVDDGAPDSYVLRYSFE